jgi:ribosomal protein L11 methylase PrmA
MPQNADEIVALPSSFRDPDGYVFRRDGEVYRRVAASYLPTLSLLHDSGLYDALDDAQMLVRHETTAELDSGVEIKPEQVPYVSYPYEWSFSELKAAALLTLDVQKKAIAHGMSLKDASAYNIQFFGSRPCFIDTLSFEPLDASSPWVAYRQFCEHFLGPLALMAYVNPELNKFIRVHLEGIPLDTTVRMLPRRTRFRYSLLVHLHLHARSQRKYAGAGSGGTGQVSTKSRMNKDLLNALIDSLIAAINGCRLPRATTEWGDYYAETNYSDASMADKEQIVDAWIAAHGQPGETVHDLGANTGRFSRIAADRGHYVVAHDVDWLAVERHFTTLRERDDVRILPLQLDISNPTPAIGWALNERESFLQRCESGFVLALALIHHLAIGNNTPLPQIAAFFAQIARKLIIEFVPKQDSQVQRMLATREDIFPDYHEEGFEQAFLFHFRIVEKRPVASSARVIYLFEVLS